MSTPRPEAPLRGALTTLRAWELEDAEWYVTARDEEIFRWTTEPRKLDAGVVRAAITQNAREPKFVGLAITDRQTGELIGNISLVLSDLERGQVEVSYWLAPVGRGRGAATDAVRVICRWAFDSLPVDRIELRTKHGNAASQRVAARTGFEPVGERDGQLLFALTQPAANPHEPVTST